MIPDGGLNCTGAGLHEAKYDQVKFEQALDQIFHPSRWALENFQRSAKTMSKCQAMIDNLQASIKSREDPFGRDAPEITKQLEDLTQKIDSVDGIVDMTLEMIESKKRKFSEFISEQEEETKQLEELLDFERNYQEFMQQVEEANATDDNGRDGHLPAPE